MGVNDDRKTLAEVTAQIGKLVFDQPPLDMHPADVRLASLDAPSHSGCTCHGLTLYSPGCHPACPAAKVLNG
jgi:hypothetical protein